MLFCLQIMERGDSVRDGVSDAVSRWKRGYRFDGEAAAWRCMFCKEAFAAGEIFPVEDRFFDAEAAARLHVEREHVSAFDAMLRLGKKVTGLTDAQAAMMACFYRRMTDAEISAHAGVAASTVRYQRHALREKARQARVFLAMAQLMEESMARGDSAREAGDPLIDIHPGATMVDDRYATTEAEAEAILRGAFSSMEPMRLRALPPKEKKKLVVLRAIADRFEQGVRYSGRQVDEVLSSIHDDRATLRRYLIEYGFMDRTTDGREYWRI